MQFAPGEVAGTAAPGEKPAAELTARALAVGLVIGVLLNVANLYLGLTAGIWDSGHITASVLGFALGRALPGRERFSILENNTVQVVATSVGSMPAAAGLIGAIPALALLGHAVAPLSIALWSVALGTLGVLLALLLAERLIVEEKLPFPTGVATAEVISAMHQSGRGRASTLFAAGGVAMVIAGLRDGAGWIPGVLTLVPLAPYTLGVSVSPLLLGVGIVAGVPTGVSMLLGSIAAWALLAPALVHSGAVAQADYQHLSAWLTWPGVALLVSAAMISLAQQAGSFRGAARDLLSLRSGAGGPRWEIFAGLGAALLALLVGRFAFGLHPLQTLGALLLSVVLGSVCARSAGETDISPASQVGELTQAVFGVVAPGNALVNIAAGSIAAGEGAQVGVTLWSLKASHLLGGSRRKQALAALAGTLAGALISVPIYALLVSAYGLASKRLPAPTALQWRAIAEVVTSGAHALPAGTGPAIAVCATLGLLLTLLGQTRVKRFVPSPLALGIGFLIPASYSATICLGSLLLAAAARLRPEWAERTAPVVGAGAIAGEALVGFALAVLVAAGVIGP